MLTTIVLLAAFAVGALTGWKTGRLDESKKRFLKRALQQARHLPGRYFA